MTMCWCDDDLGIKVYWQWTFYLWRITCFLSKIDCHLSLQRVETLNIFLFHFVPFLWQNSICWTVLISLSMQCYWRLWKISLWDYGNVLSWECFFLYFLLLNLTNFNRTYCDLIGFCFILKYPQCLLKTATHAENWLILSFVCIHYLRFTWSIRLFS